METTPSANRLHIGIFGRCNSGKSSLLNALAEQQTALVSQTPGTTTDPVVKSMEWPGIGAAVVTDTAGFDDDSELGALRLAQTVRAAERCDVALIVCSDADCGLEAEWAARFRERGVPVVAVLGRCDRIRDVPGAVASVARELGVQPVAVSARTGAGIASLRAAVAAAVGEGADATITGDLVTEGDVVLLVMPQDSAAPKGRLILPQVQTIRDALDNGAAALVVKEREYPAMLARLKTPPDLAVCDSQVVDRMVADTPPEIPCTTFSILFSRLKGDMILMARGAAAIAALRPGDKVLIAEACSHHAVSDDIGRVKIPRWLRRYAGEGLQVDVSAGRDYPENLSEYKLVIHCGGCMLNRREVLSRIQAAARAGVPVTNYGMCISFVQGVLERVLTPFPEALAAFREALAAAETARR